VVLALASIAFAQKTSVPTPPKGVQPNEIPQIGLGTARISGNTSEVIASAILNGFRHLDCAYMYGNQKDIGVGIKEGLRRANITRQELWITSKLGNDKHGQEEFNLKETLDQLGLDYLDLFLVHWPQRKKGRTFDHVETWKAMEKLVRPEKGARFIGLSNHSPSQVRDIIRIATIKPKVHQFESHPYLQQNDWVKENMKYGITVTGYAPLGNTNPVHNLGVSGSAGNRAPQILQNPDILAISKARGCTPAQVVLAWNIRRGTAVIPKASRVVHQKENLATVSLCKLTDADAAKINAIGDKTVVRLYENYCSYGNTDGCSQRALTSAKRQPEPYRAP